MGKQSVPRRGFASHRSDVRSVYHSAFEIGHGQYRSVKGDAREIIKGAAGMGHGDAREKSQNSFVVVMEVCFVAVLGS